MAELLQVCPECQKKKLYYNTDNGLSYCHYCQKGWRDSERDLDVLKYFSPETKIAAVPSIKNLVKQQEVWEGKEVTGIFEDRHCFQDRRAFCNEGRLWFPLSHHGTNGILTAYMGRTYRNEQPKWMYRGESGKKSLFHYAHPENGVIKPETKAILLVEGIFDAITEGMQHSEIAVIATLGTTISDSVASWLANQRRQIWIWLDPDAAGLKGARKIQTKLWDYGARALIVHSSTEPNETSYKSILKIYEAILQNENRRSLQCESF